MTEGQRNDQQMNGKCESVQQNGKVHECAKNAKVQRNSSMRPVYFECSERLCAYCSILRHPLYKTIVFHIF